MRARRLPRPIVGLVAAVLLLAGCGTAHPGQGVVVGDSSASLSRVDDLSRAGCLYYGVVAQTQGQQSPTFSQVRQLVAVSEIHLITARKVVERENITVTPAQKELQPAFVQQVQQVFGNRTDEVEDFLRQQNELSALFTAIGAKKTGQTPTEQNAQTVAQAGQQVVAEQVKNEDTSIDPRIGVKATGEPDPSLTSLSLTRTDPSETQVDPASLTPAQQCQGDGAKTQG